MLRWQSASGSELEERLTLGASISDIIPSSPAVYMWRRHLSAPLLAVSSPMRFREWVQKTLSVPLASLGGRELSHYTYLAGLKFGGQGLGVEKQASLELFCGGVKGRKYLATYLQSLAPFLPAVYVGEASKLDDRVKQHVSGESGLRDLVTTEMGLDFQDLDLHYCTVPPGESAKELRTLLETIATRLTVAPCVRRIG